MNSSRVNKKHSKSKVLYISNFFFFLRFRFISCITGYKDNFQEKQDEDDLDVGHVYKCLFPFSFKTVKLFLYSGGNSSLTNKHTYF